LRHQAKPYRKRYGHKEYRGRIPGRVDIAERPPVVDTRARVGDWEADLVIGHGHQGAIVTLAERRSRLYLAWPIVRKTADLTTRAITSLLAAFKDWTHTITSVVVQ
jgi:IS30 family transposase